MQLLATPRTQPRADPRELGCRCDECPLGEWHRTQGTWAPVLPENREGGSYVVLGEYPGPVEVRMRRPQVGPSGQLLESTLLHHGSHRGEAVLDNAILCFPGATMDYRAFVAGYVRRKQVARKKENVRRKEEGLPLLPNIPTPHEACRPHVLNQLARTPDVLSIGKLAHWSVSRKVVKIRKVRGAFHALKLYGDLVVDETRAEYTAPGGLPVRLVSTINPAYALRAAPWQRVFEQDVGRFFRWRRGTLDWKEPVLLSMHPNAGLVEEFLATPGAFTFDLETTFADQLVCGLRTIGVHSLVRDAGIVIPWISIKGERGFAPGFERPRRFATVEDFQTWKGVYEYREGYHYGPDEGPRIFDALVRFFKDASRPKIGQNSGYFDAAVLWRWLGIDEIAGHIDQILLARATDSELPRDLYTTGTLYTDVPSWKAAGDERSIARDPRSYEELATYNETDNAVVARTGPVLLKYAQERGQLSVVEVDHHVQAACREMHQIGLYVAEPVRQKFEDELNAKVAKAKKTMQDAVGSSAFNPDSTKDLRDLLYSAWSLPVVKLTATGLASTDEDALRTLQVSRGLLNEQQRAFILGLWAYRANSKALSSVVLPLRPAHRGGRVGPSGLIYPHYNCHAPATGRISSSNPPTQNWEKWLRALVTPRRHDHVFVQADYDQIELRLLCAVAMVEAYLEVFRTGGDPHAVTAVMIYGERFEAELEKKVRYGIKTRLFDSLRRFAKTFVYAVLYGGTATTVYENVSKATDEDPKSPTYGELLFPDMTLAQVEAATRRWMEAAHQIPAWWQTQWDFAIQHGYITEPVLGRRRDFPAFERNEVINHPIQGGAAAIMHGGLIRLRQKFPPNFGRGTGLINQMHDAITVECHERDAERVRQLVTESLYAKFDHIPGIEFTAEAAVTVSWDEAKPTGRYLAEGLGLELEENEKPEIKSSGGDLWQVVGKRGSQSFKVAAESVEQASLRAGILIARGEAGKVRVPA